jgi:hypothetical protein
MSDDPDEIEDLFDQLEESDPWSEDHEPCNEYDRRMDLIRDAVEKIQR